MLRPIILLGVPRSGTTLLRVLLGSHSQLLAAPETPWIAGGYGPTSVRQLVELLLSDPHGPVATMSGLDRDEVWSATTAPVHRLLERYLTHHRRARLVLKTPDDVLHLDFLARLFPEASWVHLVRDGRDVACSTAAAREKLGPELKGYGANTRLNALARWCDWEERVRAAHLEGRIPLAASLRYEALVQAPAATLAELCGALGLEMEPGMLDYHGRRHDLPASELGAQEVRAKAHIDPGSVGRWRRECSGEELAEMGARFGAALLRLGYSHP